MFSGFIDEGREAQKVGRQTTAVIKSTGGAANLTAKGFQKLAGRLSDYAAVDDEVIQGGENILATFTRIKAGGPERVFERASKAAVDMAAAMGHGEVNADNLQSANLRLGKALNDPLRGMTALTRVGVTFSNQQREQIKNFVEAGDVAAAQGVILDEVAKEFGGSAAASATGWDRFKVALGNFQEFVGTALLPVIDRAGRFLGGTLVPALEGFAKSVAEKFGPALGDLTAAVQEKFDTFKLDAKIFGRNLAAKIKGTAGAVIVGFQAALRTGDWSQLGEIIGNILRTAVGNGADLIKRAFGAVDWFKVGKEAAFIMVPFAFGLFDAFLSALWKQGKEHPTETIGAILSLIPLGRLGGAIARIIAKIPILRAFAPLFRGLEGVGRAVEKPIGAIVGAIAKFFGKAIERAFPGIGRRIGDWALKWILGISSKFNQMRKAGTGFIRGLVEGILDQAGLVIRNIAQVIGWLTKPFRAIGGWLIRRGRELIQGLGSGIVAKLGDVTAWMGRIVSRVTSPFAKALGWLYQKGRDVIWGLLRGLKDKFVDVVTWLKELPGRIIKLKGPPAVDATLLVNAGELIMGGFLAGLKTGGKGALDYLKGFGIGIADFLGGVFGGIGQGGTSGNLQTLAQRMAAGYGWTGAQWNALRNLVQSESGWNPGAQNPTSTAYGLFQFLDSTWGSVGAVKTSSPVGQIAAGLRYIKSQYGSPLAAWSAWLSRSPHWYGSGVEGIFARPTLIGVGERGPEAVSVTPLGRRIGGGGIDYDRMADAFVRALERRPPVVAVDAIHTGLLAKKRGQGRIKLGLD